MRVIAFLLLLMMPSAAFAVDVSEVPNPRDDNRWVTDLADMIAPIERRQLNSRIQGINQDYGIEIAVVTVDSVNTATPKDFATKLFNYWGIGQASKNNGLLVLMVKGERRLEMETGYGLEPILTDGWLKAMQQAEMIPSFKQGRYGEGLIAGVEASIQRLRAYHEAGNVIPESKYVIPKEQDPNSIYYLILGGSGLAAAGGFGARKYKRAQDRKCLSCSEPGELLDEQDEDAHLSEEEQLEEAIGSIKYDVYWCKGCQEARVVGRNKWFSGYSSCAGCGRKTGSASSVTLSYPTEYSSGSEQVTETCANCSYSNTYTKIIPRIQPSTSSSSGGSSGGSSGSFGGGSSGGGGAGSSW